MINIFVIDDHPVYIDGLKSVFANGEDGINISKFAHSAKEALPLLSQSNAKVVLLDLMMPGITGDKFCLTIKKKFPKKKVIALTGELNTSLLYNVWMNKADAIIMKYSGKDEIVNAVKAVLTGQRFVGASVPEFRNQFVNSGNGKPKLTNREKQILNLLAKGYTREAVGSELGSNLNAISFHCKNIFNKLNRNKLVAVIEEAKKHNLIDE